MNLTTVNGIDLRKMLSAGLSLLAERYREVDSLNVFPVPDGDTGTNMYLTLSAAVEGISGTDRPDAIGEVAEAAAKGALMGARGNSGVILSQILRGLAKELKEMDQVSVEHFADAMEHGVKLAYQAVMKPVEGTILTVAKEAAHGAIGASRKNEPLIRVLEEAILSAEETLSRTPELLPVLKKAGVVDAGGMGWLIILRGFKAGLTDQVTVEEIPINAVESGRREDIRTSHDFLYPYCTELLVKTEHNDSGLLREQLQNMGSSLMVVQADEFTRVHVHTDHPGRVLEECLKYGPISKISVSNMIEQALAAGAEPFTGRERKPLAIVSVALGAGIENIMMSLGADRVVQGGQTMNPSTRDLLSAVEEANAETVILLPNNGNILLTARQVSELTETKVKVLDTRTVPQGIAALLAVVPEMEPEKIFSAMKEAAGGIKTGEVTYAARDSAANGMDIRTGDIIGIADDGIAAFGADVDEVALALIEMLLAAGGDICSVYYGQDIPNKQAGDLLCTLEEKYPDLEFELHYGGQPFYYYIISIE